MAKKPNKFMEFDDFENKLRWIRFNAQVADRYADLNALVNLWSHDSQIRKYVTGETNNQGLADFLTGMIVTDDHHDEGLFYCCDRADNILGVAYIIAPIEHENKTSIEYVVVDPRNIGKGIATRMVKSIRDNSEFFTYGKHKGEIVAAVEHSNEASIKTFVKNGFEEIKPLHPTSSSIIDGRYDPLANYNKYTRLYFGESREIKDDEMAD